MESLPDTAHIHHPDTPGGQPRERQSQQWDPKRPKGWLLIILNQHCPTELSAMMKTFCICTVQEVSTRKVASVTEDLILSFHFKFKELHVASGYLTEKERPRTILEIPAPLAVTWLGLMTHNSDQWERRKRFLLYWGRSGGDTHTRQRGLETSGNLRPPDISVTLTRINMKKIEIEMKEIPI